MVLWFSRIVKDLILGNAFNSRQDKLENHTCVFLKLRSVCEDLEKNAFLNLKVMLND